LITKNTIPIILVMITTDMITMPAIAPGGTQTPS